MAESIQHSVNVYPPLPESLEAVHPKMKELEDKDLLQITVDPGAAVSTARGALPRIFSYRDQLSKLANFDIEDFDQLPVYASAALQATMLYQAASAPPEHFQQLVAEATALRESLLTAATALAQAELISGDRLGELKGPVGYRNIASDVLTLMNIIRNSWASVSARTAVTEEELDRAQWVGNQLFGDIGMRAQSPAAIAAFALERQQSYTLFVNAYDEARRGLSYLRWREGDVDRIAPSLFSGRKRKATTDAEVTEEAVPVTTPAAATVVSSIAATATKPAVGLPGADPFAS